MFNYLNGTTSAAEHHRQQQQHSNGNRPTRSSSGSGGDSDECRSNRATRNSDTPSPGNPTTDGSSPTDMDNSSHSGGSNHSSSRSGTSSQLRQMLLASNGESIMTTTSSRTKSCSSSSSSSRSNTTQHSNTDDSNNMYKFKTNIHQRFTADLEHVFPQSSCLMTPSSTSSLPEQNHHSQQAMERSFEQQSKTQFQGIKRKNILITPVSPDSTRHEAEKVRLRERKAQSFQLEWRRSSSSATFFSVVEKSEIELGGNGRFIGLRRGGRPTPSTTTGEFADSTR